jgi:hypothetical protein
MVSNGRINAKDEAERGVCGMVYGSGPGLNWVQGKATKILGQPVSTPRFEPGVF